MTVKTPTRTRTRAATSSGPQRVNLQMVAKLAGVSPSTVSRILNGTAAVSPDKKAAVDAAIAQLGFVPDPVARGLAGGRTLSVGVLTQALNSPFYGVAMRGIEDELDNAGYNALFVSGHWNATEEVRCVDMLLSRRVDGVIILTGRLSDAALRAYAKQVPIVVTGRQLKAANLYSLSFDNFEGARLATHHLLALGHQRICFIGGDPGHPDATERLRGYRAAVEAAGIGYNPKLVIPGMFQEEGGLAAVEQMIDSRQRCTAIFAANDQMAMGACLGLHRRAMRVPHDVSVVGFDDLSISAYATPPLTTVHHPAYELGKLAATAMLQLLRGEKPTAKAPQPRVIVRGSTRAPAQPG